MSANDTAKWNKKTQGMKKAGNLAYSYVFDTVGFVSGDNSFWTDDTPEKLLTDYDIIHWHGLTLDYTFKKKLIGVEPFDGFKIAAKDLEILVPGKKPLIQDWDYLEPIRLRHVIDDPQFLQRIILLQEASIEKLQTKIAELETRCYKLEKVCILYMFNIQITDIMAYRNFCT